MEGYGVCRFCGQSVIVEADEGASQDNLDALASYNCSCSAAEVVFEDEIDGITIKQGEFTYKIKKDKDGYLQISSEYKKTNTEEF